MWEWGIGGIYRGEGQEVGERKRGGRGGEEEWRTEKIKKEEGVKICFGTSNTIAPSKHNNNNRIADQPHQPACLADIVIRTVKGAAGAQLDNFERGAQCIFVRVRMR